MLKQKKFLAKNISCALGTAILSLSITSCGLSALGNTGIVDDAIKVIEEEYDIEVNPKTGNTEIVKNSSFRKQTEDGYEDVPFSYSYTNPDTFGAIVDYLHDKGMNDEEIYVFLDYTFSSQDKDFVKEINEKYLGNINAKEAFGAKLAYSFTRKAKRYNR